MKILSQLIKTGLGLKLIFGDFSFRDLFTTEENPSINEVCTFYDFYKEGWEDRKTFSGKIKREELIKNYDYFFDSKKFNKQYIYNMKKFNPYA